MFDLYLTEPFVPFTIALALLFGLLALEILLSLIGATLLGLGADADVDLDLDIEGPELGDLDIDFGDADASLFDFAEPEVDIDADIADAPAPPSGPASWLGIGKVPTLIWIASVLLAFGVTGFVLQMVATTLIGTALPALLITLPAGIAAIGFARRFGAVFARALPKTETSAMSNRHLGRRTGVVTQGTAKRGSPAEVRITDRHGNMHHLRGEPLKDEETISAGTEVLVLRHRFNEGYRLVALGPDN